MENPFKFGTIVEEKYFTDRVEEVAYIEQFMKSANHLVLISPRRFGKSSVVAKAMKQIDRKHITVNLQQVTSVSDLSAENSRPIAATALALAMTLSMLSIINNVQDIMRMLGKGAFMPKYSS